MDESAILNVYDPQVTREQMMEEFKYTLDVTEDTVPNLNRMVNTVDSMIDACKGSHAIAVMTEWDEFATADYQALYDVMQKPAFVFDGRNIVPHDKLREIGFEVYAIGKPHELQF